MKNKIIFLQIRRHYGELEWLFPLLFRLYQKDFKIFTYFDEQNAYYNLKNNSILFNKWKQISNDYFIQKKTDRIVFKIILRIFIYLNKFIKFSFIQKIIDIFSNKVYDLKKILKTNDINNFQYYFLSNNNHSRLYKLFQDKIEKLKIIRFPTSQHVRFLKDYKNFSNEGQGNFYGDNFLFRYIEEAKIYFGNKRYKSNLKKIIFCGNMKYENWWLKELFTQKKNLKSKKKIIFFATRGFLSDKKNIKDKAKRLSEKSFIYMINSMMELTKKKTNLLIIFKTHPSNKEYSFLLKILSNYKRSNWRIDNNYSLSTIEKCELGVVMLSSVCLDVLSMRKPCIEFWINNEDNFGLIKKKNNYFTTYQLNGLVKNVNSSKELIKTLDNLDIKKNYNNMIKKQYLNFKRVNKLDKYDSKKTLKKILN